MAVARRVNKSRPVHYPGVNESWSPVWATAATTVAHTATGYLCLIRRKVTEFAGKVYVNFFATPEKVDVAGATGV